MVNANKKIKTKCNNNTGSASLINDWGAGKNGLMTNAVRNDALAAESEGQDDILFGGDAPQVQNCITHAPQGGVDAYAGDLGNLLEGESLIVTHGQYLTLQFRQLLDQKLYVGAYLVGYQDILDGLLAQFLAVQYVDIRDVGALQILGFLLPVVVDY